MSKSFQSKFKQICSSKRILLLFIAISNISSLLNFWLLAPMRIKNPSEQEYGLLTPSDTSIIKILLTSSIFISKGGSQFLAVSCTWDFCLFVILIPLISLLSEIPI